MKKLNKSEAEQRWLKALGKNIDAHIKAKGYASPYDFWIQVGEDMSRTTLNYILNGQVDVRVTTLRKIALALEISPEELLKIK